MGVNVLYKPSIKITKLFRQHGLWLLLPFCLILGSCSVSDRWEYEDSEGVVPESFFSSVKKNKTDKAWLIQNLGSPYGHDTGPNNEEIYTYAFTRKRFKRASLLVVLRFDGSEEERKYYHVLFCENTVDKAWWDEFSEVQVDRVLKRAKCKEEPPRMREMTEKEKREEAKQADKAAMNKQAESTKQQVELAEYQSASDNRVEESTENIVITQSSAINGSSSSDSAQVSQAVSQNKVTTETIVDGSKK